jgi:hypothetical protein
LASWKLQWHSQHEPQGPCCRPVGSCRWVPTPKFAGRWVSLLRWVCHCEGGVLHSTCLMLCGCVVVHGCLLAWGTRAVAARLVPYNTRWGLHLPFQMLAKHRDDVCVVVGLRLSQHAIACQRVNQCCVCTQLLARHAWEARVCESVVACAVAICIPGYLRAICCHQPKMPQPPFLHLSTFFPLRRQGRASLVVSLKGARGQLGMGACQYLRTLAAGYL